MNRVSIFLNSIAIAGTIMSSVALAQVNAPGTAPAPTVVTPAPVTPQPPIRICPYRDLLLQPGSSGSDVRVLQQLLAQDSSVYPQGLATGYYGNLTAEAVKRLQKKVGLPQTGIVDEDTRQIIFPCMTLRIVSPNGGEVWRTGETHRIAWEADPPYYTPVMLHGTSNLAKEGRIREVIDEVERSSINPTLPGSITPYYSHLSIDLLKLDGPQTLVYPTPVYYHIGSASLYGERSFSWTIPQTIPDSRAYKIRISLWKDVPYPFDCKDPAKPCPLVGGITAYPISWKEALWDESDEMFSILGGPQASPTAAPTIAPTPVPDRGKLIELRTQLQQALESVQKAINILNQLIGVMPPTPPSR